MLKTEAAGMWSRSIRLGLETASRHTNVSSRSRLGLVSDKILNVTVSHLKSEFWSKLVKINQDNLCRASHEHPRVLFYVYVACSPPGVVGATFHRASSKPVRQRGSTGALYRRSRRRASAHARLVQGRPHTAGCRGTLPYRDRRRSVVVAYSGSTAGRQRLVSVHGRQRRRHSCQPSSTYRSRYAKFTSSLLPPPKR